MSYLWQVSLWPRVSLHIARPNACLCTAALASLAALAVSIIGPNNALAGVEDWELSEVHPQSDGDPQLRFVELVDYSGGCLFPTSTLDLYDSQGTLVDILSLALVTTCFGAPTYLLLATTQAANYFGVDRDLNLFI